MFLNPSPNDIAPSTAFIVFRHNSAIYRIEYDTVSIIAGSKKCLKSAISELLLLGEKKFGSSRCGQGSNINSVGFHIE